MVVQSVRIGISGQSFYGSVKINAFVRREMNRSNGIWFSTKIKTEQKKKTESMTNTQNVRIKQNSRLNPGEANKIKIKIKYKTKLTINKMFTSTPKSPNT